MSDERGLGLYRGLPDTIADNLSPGQPPAPSEGFQGPPVALPVEAWARVVETINKVGERVALQGFDLVYGSAQGQTDSEGTLVLGLYQITAGVEAKLHRLVVNALDPTTNVPYTPADPYSNSGVGYLELYTAEVPRVEALGPIGLLDFGPPVSTDPFLPALFTDNSMQASGGRGPMWFVLYVVGGPNSSMVTARYQISLRRESGIA